MFLVLMEQAVVSNENKARDDCNKARKRRFAALAEPEEAEGAGGYQLISGKRPWL